MLPLVIMCCFAVIFAVYIRHREVEPHWIWLNIIINFVYAFEYVAPITLPGTLPCFPYVYASHFVVYSYVTV